jgi:hypothetical protein
MVLSAGAEWLLAQEQREGVSPGQSLDSQASGSGVLFEDVSEPWLQPLPEPNESILGEVAQPGATPPGGRPGANSPGESGRSPFTARLWWIPQQNLQNQAGDLAMNGEEVDVAFPLCIAPEGIWLGIGSVQRLEISTSAVLPDSGLPVPAQLWDIEIGAMHFRTLHNGWRAGGMFRVGSPSDRPFASLRDMTVTLLGFLTIPSGERDEWNLSLFYSPTGQIIYPIPGVAYVWRPNPQFRASLGIPFSLEYRPTETLTVTASYRPLNNVQVLVRQSLGEAWSIYGSYGTMNETFLLAERLENRERTYLFDQRLTLGVRRELGHGWSLDLSTAYVFDRQIFQAEKFSGSRRDELVIDPGVAGMLQIVWTR